MRSTVGLYREMAEDTMVADGEDFVNMKSGDKIVLDMVGS